MADRELALTMWAARKPDGGWLHPDIDEIAWACGYANGDSLKVVMSRLRKAGDIPKRYGGRAWRRRQVVKLIRAGLSSGVIAERLGIDVDSISVFAMKARRAGELPALDSNRATKAWTGDEELTLARLVAAALTSRQISAEMGRSRSAIISKTHRTGLRLRNPPCTRGSGLCYRAAA